MPAARLEFFFDYSSPWTFLAFTQIERVCARCGADVDWKPILVGGIFNTVNPSVYEARKAKPVPAKARYGLRDLQQWADAYGVKIRGPYGGTKGKLAVFPVNSTKACRGAFTAMREGKMAAYSWAVFRSYWSDGEDISRDDVLRRIASSVGIDPANLLRDAATAEAKQRLRANTGECVRRGGFGSPTMFVGDEMWFGNDRLPLVEHRLRALAGAAPLFTPPPKL